MLRSLKGNKLVFLTLVIVLFLTSLSFATQPANSLEKNKPDSKLIPIVNKYSPETLEDWKEILEEKKDLRKQLVKQYKSQNRILDSNTRTIKARKNKFADKLREQVEKGEITRQEAKEKFEKFKSECKGNKDCQYKKERAEIINLRKELAKAVEENDVPKIKILLHELYGKFEESNQRIKSKLNN